MSTALYPFIIAIMVATLVILLATATARKRIVIGDDGVRRAERSDLEKILSPVLANVRVKDRARLKQELAWAGLGRIEPEMWTAITLFAGPVALFASLSFMVMLNLDLGTGGLLAGLAGIMGFTYPRMKKSGALRRRSAAIHEDVPVFMSLFARLVVSYATWQNAFIQMANLVVSERKRYNDPLLLPETRARLMRMRGHRPFDSELWSELVNMVFAAQTTTFHSAGANRESPDPLMRFALQCDNKDLSRFVGNLRDSLLENTPMKSAQIDLEVTDIRLARIEEVERSFATLMAKATVYLVMFNMPLLLLAALAPAIGPLVGGLG